MSHPVATGEYRGVRPIQMVALVAIESEEAEDREEKRGARLEKVGLVQFLLCSMSISMPIICLLYYWSRPSAQVHISHGPLTYSPMW
jgi:hypothetical protein